MIQQKKNQTYQTDKATILFHNIKDCNKIQFSFHALQQYSVKI